MIKKARKRRSDRLHLVYKLQVKTLVYIGVTYVDQGNVSKSIRRRWKKHVQRAMAESKTWKLCQAIRKYGPDRFEVEVLNVVRGKTAAHEIERTLIKTMKPKLNTCKS